MTDMNTVKDMEEDAADLTPKGKICIVPSLLTTVSLFSGFYAIIAAIDGMYVTAAIAILISGVFDGMDGRVARLTGTSSRFGMEYDSLCDLVAFGVAPALLAYLWVLQPFGRYGWLAAFLYVATTALRLARFNAKDVQESADNFTGLPCPAAGCMIATTVLFCGFWGIEGSARNFAVLALVYFLSYLMVSTFRYLSFKKPTTAGAKFFQVLVVTVLVIMVVATEPRVTLFVMGLLYVCSGPVTACYRLLFKLTKKKKAVV